MSLKFRDLLERTYDTRLSSKGNYAAQLGHLDENGELANKRKLGELIFSMCEYLDQLDTRLEALESATASKKEASSVKSPNRTK